MKQKKEEDMPPKLGTGRLKGPSLHRLWFIIEGMAPCRTSRHLRSHYRAAPGNMTQTEAAAAHGCCAPSVIFFLLYQPHLTILLLSLHHFSVNSLEIAVGLKLRFSQAMITEANMLTMPYETKHFYIHVVPDSNM